MKRHLSAREVSEWTVGERPPERRVHVEDCGQCRAALDRLDGSLALFRGAMREWGRKSMIEARNHAAAPKWRRARFGPLRLAAAVCVALAVAAVPVLRHAADPESFDGSIDDDALLRQVDAEISRPVARPMEPLAQLMPWDSVKQNETQESQRITQ